MCLERLNKKDTKRLMCPAVEHQPFFITGLYKLNSFLHLYISLEQHDGLDD